MENGVFRLTCDSCNKDDDKNYENEFISILPNSLISLIPIKVTYPDIDAVCRRFPYNDVNEKNNFVLIDVNNQKCEIDRIIQGIEYNNDMGILINGFNNDVLDYYTRLKFIETKRSVISISPSSFEYIKEKIQQNNEVKIEFKRKSNKEWKEIENYVNQDKWGKEINKQEEQLNSLINLYKGELKKNYLANLYNLKIKKPYEEL